MPAETAGEINAAHWLETDPKGFRALMVKLESELAQGKVVRTEAQAEGADLGSETALELIERILSRAEVESK